MLFLKIEVSFKKKPYSSIFQLLKLQNILLKIKQKYILKFKKYLRQNASAASRSQVECERNRYT